MDKITQAELKELLNYNPETGAFTWLKTLSNRGKIGSLAGSFDKDGYINIGINSKTYKSHRLAWLYMTGNWPKNEIDHVNGGPSDNRFSNLREATRSENSMNTRMSSSNSSGYKGVWWAKRVGKWESQIKCNKNKKHLGYFDDKEDAYKAYCLAAKEDHKEFANLG